MIQMSFALSGRKWITREENWNLGLTHYYFYTQQANQISGTTKWNIEMRFELRGSILLNCMGCFVEAKGKTFRVFLPKTFEEKHLISAARLFSLELLHGFVLLSAQYENVPKFRLDPNLLISYHPNLGWAIIPLPLTYKRIIKIYFTQLNKSYTAKTLSQFVYFFV